MAARKTTNPVATSKFAKTAKLSVAIMISTLKDGDSHSYKDLMEVTGLSQRTIAEWVIAFRRKKLVRIGAWLPDTRRLGGIAEFIWDETQSKPDCPKPRLGSSVTRQRYRNKLRLKETLHRLAGNPQNPS